MKRIYRLTPVSQYDIAGLESWLEDMAAGGLYLKTFRPLFCTFTRGEPRQTRYRLEPQRRTLVERPAQSMLDLYQEFGWELVDSVDDAMLLFSTQDLHAPELHSDPAIQRDQWLKLYKSSRRALAGNLILFLLLCLPIWYLLPDSHTPISNLLTTNLPLLLCCLLLTICSLLGQCLQLRALSRISRQLKEGAALDHRAAYPRHRPQSLIFFLTYVVLLTALIACQYVLPFIGGGPKPLDQLTDFTPLSLSALEGDNFESSHYMGDGVDYSSFCDRERYLLCWDQWRVIQSGTPDPSGHWVRMEIDWYDPLLSSLAPALAKEQLERYTALDDDIWWVSDRDADWTVAEHDFTGTAYLATARREDGFQIAAVAANGKTAVVRYTGHGDLTDHLDEIADMVIH